MGRACRTEIAKANRKLFRPVDFAFGFIDNELPLWLRYLVSLENRWRPHLSE